MLGQGENCVPCPSGSIAMDRRWKPNVELAPNCPRCDSSSTKFCYYNNYSLTQPRYFCKGCRRYWTKGGSLRKVPIGGGCRKNRRGKSIRMSSHSVGSSANYGAIFPGVRHPGLPIADSIQNSYRSSDNSAHPSTSMSSSDGSSIDLALIYAKFLNREPDSEPPGHVMPEFPREFNVSQFELPIVSDNNMDQDIGFLHGNDLVGCHGQFDPSSSDSSILLHHKQEDRTNPQFGCSDTSSYGFQPILLPAEEELATPDLFWSHLPIVTPNFTCQSMQVKGFEPVVDDGSMFRSNQLNGNWSSLDFSELRNFLPSRP